MRRSRQAILKTVCFAFVFNLLRLKLTKKSSVCGVALRHYHEVCSFLVIL